MVIVLNLILNYGIMFILIMNLKSMFRLKLNRKYVVYAYMIMKESLLELNVDIMYVMDVIKN